MKLKLSQIPKSGVCKWLISGILLAGISTATMNYLIYLQDNNTIYELLIEQISDPGIICFSLTYVYILLSKNTICFNGITNKYIIVRLLKDIFIFQGIFIIVNIFVCSIMSLAIGKSIIFFCSNSELFSLLASIILLSLRFMCMQFMAMLINNYFSKGIGFIFIIIVSLIDWIGITTIESYITAQFLPVCNTIIVPLNLSYIDFVKIPFFNAICYWIIFFSLLFLIKSCINTILKKRIQEAT